MTISRCVIFKAPIRTSSVSRTGYTQPDSLAAAGRPDTRWRSPRLDESLLAQDLTPRISRGHLHISFRNSHTFLFNHRTASAFFTGVSCAETLWLRAQSKVNMQHQVQMFLCANFQIFRLSYPNFIKNLCSFCLFLCWH